MVARIRCSSRRVAAFESRSPCPAWARQRRSAFVGRGSSSFPLSHLSEYRRAPRLRRRDRGAPGFTPGAPNVGGVWGAISGPPILLVVAAVRRRAPSVWGRGAPRLRRGATSGWGSRRATASPGRDERLGVEARHGFAGARRAVGGLGGWGGHFGAPHLLSALGLA